jgi:hypothetical protein
VCARRKLRGNSQHGESRPAPPGPQAAQGIDRPACRRSVAPGCDAE